MHFYFTKHILFGAKKVCVENLDGMQKNAYMYAIFSKIRGIVGGLFLSGIN